MNLAVLHLKQAAGSWLVPTRDPTCCLALVR
jgi:hypothetical protein